MSFTAAMIMILVGIILGLLFAAGCVGAVFKIVFSTKGGTFSDVSSFFIASFVGMVVSIMIFYAGLVFGGLELIQMFF
jgi:hypothetical protein